MRRRAVSIRRSLLVRVSLLIVLLSGAILATMLAGERQAVHSLSRSLIAQSIEQTVERLQRFFDPVVAGLALLRSWGEAGLLEDGDPAALHRLLVPIMRPYPQISAVLMADERGREYMLLRHGEHWRGRRTRKDAPGGRTLFVEWRDSVPGPASSWRELDYDPRTRPWYRGAAQRRAAGAAASPADLVHWTEPYTFFTMEAPGITVATTFEAAGRLHVVGVDVLLADVSIFTSGLRPSPHGQVAVLSAGDRVLGLPRDVRFADAGARQRAVLARPAELGLTVVADAMRAVSHPDLGPAEFLSEGRPWWAGVRSFELGPGRALAVVVAIPESDLVGNLARLRQWILLLSGAALGLAMVWAAVLARRYSRPIETLVKESHRISRGDLERGEAVRSSVAEVQQLVAAHETMRQSLRRLFKTERDLQLARQIQQSTLPETLPTLEGFEIDTWSEPAEETGGDVYDVVGFDGDGLTIGPARRAVLLVADASGHGIGPALSVTQVRAMLRMAARTGQGLATMVECMNAQLATDLRDGHFITAWFGLLDAGAGTLASLSCGQAPILHYRAAADEWTALAADTPPLGVLAEVAVRPPEPHVLQPGDMVAVLSDGIFEACNATGEAFGSGRATAVIREHRAAPAAAILAALRAALAAFTQGGAADDDRTALIVKRLT
jgi:serine phosphatase RsbU (regulator of sigma subunit)